MEQRIFKVNFIKKVFEQNLGFCTNFYTYIFFLYQEWNLRVVVSTLLCFWFYVAVKRVIVEKKKNYKCWRNIFFNTATLLGHINFLLFDDMLYKFNLTACFFHKPSFRKKFLYIALFVYDNVLQKFFPV